MAGPDYGALGATFKIVRLLQVISLLGCTGMAANFISEMVSQDNSPSEELVGTLSVVGISLHFDHAKANVCNVDLHRHPLLRNHCYSAHRQHPPVPHQHWDGWSDAHRLICGCNRCWQAPFVFGLPSRRHLQCCRIGISAELPAQGHLQQARWKGCVQQLDWCEQDHMLRDESHLGSEHCTLVSLFCPVFGHHDV